ncbi:hypothetical protein [Spirosoma utsteinense]|uniref:tRNA A37 threonylcarbamoyladenosine synthetase subunit TsaC/SUA5/YrdC n=1 Tax=Spirosoma utsteinense TaxID=2585773 RepID=A0ABR6WAE8_9BACT|nr:hypothetical protein [Spirosoma utsteinense]MBC3787181.1 tRNA A37 threonylcarbamoyladenosine synthetase subunit TsaC/SUA5/YrdC [Spirosoma utsteinense]MBC3792865.1 tRNA A37 threonylcarbamoyladenosine synthetase subunit TsaC/SUA5/YrdC [Spirosoma utsteinense]
MTILPISDPAALAVATQAIHQGPILVQLPRVFALLAAPTRKGAQQLDATKVRLAGKHYGTAIGSLAKFVAQAQPGGLPAEFSRCDQFRVLTGSFVRLQFHPQTFQSITIRNGTHQGLILGGDLRSLFKGLEASFDLNPAEQMWNQRNYNAPLCTSCNLSGDAQGSITEYEKAYRFGKARGIEILITGVGSTGEKGSYPILGIEPHGVRIHRVGPGLARIKERIPIGLQSWSVDTLPSTD